VGKAGTAAVTGPELSLALAASPRADRGMLNRTQLLDAVAEARSRGERIVFTNGCFDILHAGHVAYLEEARALGDRLVVAVNDDASVRRLKGAGRPVNPLEMRLRVLSGLVAVDWVVGFPEDTPEALLEAVRPEVLVKGGDYAAADVVGADLVRRYGGEVRVLGLVADLSTTALVQRIRQDG
jgi:D-beta-D-heptose 7-phosphate kinase / D-beta-D-heptose 1-phosphate adenosyltransferase